MKEAIYTAILKGFKPMWKIEIDGEVRYKKMRNLPAFVIFNDKIIVASPKKSFLGWVLGFFYFTGQ